MRDPVITRLIVDPKSFSLCSILKNTRRSNSILSLIIPEDTYVEDILVSGSLIKIDILKIIISIILNFSI
jgi:hypothetical protein